MMSAVTTARLGREFDKFLYASVGDDDNGMPLTVLSTLARLDVDPWEEASKLTRLPQERAVTQLACLLGALRNAPPISVDPASVAAPLIALLPHHSDRAPPMLKALTQAAPTKHPATVSTLLTVLTYVIFMLLGRSMMGSLQASRQTQPTVTSAPTIDSPSAPISSEGRQNLVK
jgi:hypothetical protein